MTTSAPKSDALASLRTPEIDELRPVEPCFMRLPQRPIAPSAGSPQEQLPWQPNPERGDGHEPWPLDNTCNQDAHLRRAWLTSGWKRLQFDVPGLKPDHCATQQGHQAGHSRSHAPKVKEVVLESADLASTYALFVNRSLHF